jgi:hypothetical protein
MTTQKYKSVTLPTLQRQWAYQTLRFKIDILEKILKENCFDEGDMWNLIAKKLKLEVVDKISKK